MKLKHLKTSKCPHCGAPTISEKIDSVHVNGQQREFRAFKCGCTIEYSPNVGKEVEFRGCPNSKVNKLINKNRKIAVTKLIGYISKLTVDDEFKRIIKREVMYHKP